MCDGGFDRYCCRNRGRTHQQPYRVQAQTRNHNVRRQNQ